MMIDREDIVSEMNLRSSGVASIKFSAYKIITYCEGGSVFINSCTLLFFAAINLIILDEFCDVEKL